MGRCRAAERRDAVSEQEFEAAVRKLQQAAASGEFVVPVETVLVALSEFAKIIRDQQARIDTLEQWLNAQETDGR